MWKNQNQPQSDSGTRTNHTDGFTLVELLVVITLVAMLLLSVSAMFMTFLVGNTQTNIRRQIKGEGNTMISQLEFLFRSAQKVQKGGVDLSESASPTTCTSSGSQFLLEGNPIVIQDAYNNLYTISYDPAPGAKVIKVQNGAAAAAALNTSKVVPTSPTVTCYGVSGSEKKSIKIEFELQWQDNAMFKEKFGTTVQIRNS